MSWSWFPHSFASVVQPSIFLPRFSIASHDVVGPHGLPPFCCSILLLIRNRFTVLTSKIVLCHSPPAVLFPSKMLCSSPMCRATCIPKASNGFPNQEGSPALPSRSTAPWPHLLRGADHMCLSTFLHSLHTVTTWIPHGWPHSGHSFWSSAPGLLYHQSTAIGSLLACWVKIFEDKPVMLIL